MLVVSIGRKLISMRKRDSDTYLGDIYRRLRHTSDSRDMDPHQKFGETSGIYSWPSSGRVPPPSVTESTTHRLLPTITLLKFNKKTLPHFRKALIKSSPTGIINVIYPTTLKHYNSIHKHSTPLTLLCPKNGDTWSFSHKTEH